MLCQRIYCLNLDSWYLPSLRFSEVFNHLSFLGGRLAVGICEFIFCFLLLVLYYFLLSVLARLLSIVFDLHYWAFFLLYYVVLHTSGCYFSLLVLHCRPIFLSTTLPLVIGPVCCFVYVVKSPPAFRSLVLPDVPYLYLYFALRSSFFWCLLCALGFWDLLISLWL